MSRLRRVVLWGVAAIVLVAAIAVVVLSTRTQAVDPYRGAHPPAEAAIAFNDRPVLALALGGGGPRGFAHVGVLKVLEAAAIRPDLIVGASAGSVIGAAYASGRTAAAVERLALELRSEDIADFAWSLRPYFRGQALAGTINRIVADKRLEALAIPLAVVVTDARSGDPVVFTRGDTGAAVRASSAIPGYYRRLRIGSREFLDGDIAAPVPASIARGLGADLVVAVNVMTHMDEIPDEVKSYPDLILPDYLRHSIVAREAASADVMIHPRLPFYADYSEAYRREAIAIGEHAAREALPQMCAAIERAFAAKRLMPRCAAPPPAGTAPRTGG